MSNDTRMRAAEVADADAIGLIHVLGWRVAYAGLMPEEFLRGLSVRERQDRWRERVRDDSRVLVAVERGAVVGFASFGASRDHDGPDVGELYAIYLHPECWGLGVGRRLHSRAVDALRDAGFLRATLWVLEANDRAQRFYRAAGWVADGARKTDSFGGSPPMVEVRYSREL